MDAKRAASLLYPIAAFLHKGGLSKAESLNCFEAAMEKAVSSKRVKGMVYIGHPTCYADTVANWIRDKKYLDATGRPRVLRFTGKLGFAALVRQTSRATNPRTVLSVLKRYGNVRELRDGKLELIRPFFVAGKEEDIAFEPTAYFLSDASVTLQRMLKRQQYSRGPQPFWRKVESIHISEAMAKKFTLFARERSLLFLQELDDWLDAHAAELTRGKDKSHRVGLGLFSIYSDLEPPTPNL